MTARKPGLRRKEFFNPVGGMSLADVSARTGLSERWVRELVKRHGLRIRTIPWSGGYRLMFTLADVEQIESIHNRNQSELQRRHPALYAAVGKVTRVPRRAVRSRWGVV